MSTFIKISFILSFIVSVSLADSEKEISKKNEKLSTKSNSGKKIETPEVVLERLKKDGEKKGNIDNILNGNTGNKTESVKKVRNEEKNSNSNKSKSNSGNKKESVEDILERFRKDGEKNSNTDNILNGKTGFKL
jgi:hypothetical protein